MPNQKPVSITAHLSRDKHPDLIDFLNRPEISTSLAIREGLRLLVEREEGRQTFEAKAIQLLEQIAGALSGGVALSPKVETTPDKYNDPFLDTSL